MLSFAHEQFGIGMVDDVLDFIDERVLKEPDPNQAAEVFHSPQPRKRPRVPFGTMLECGYLQPGQAIYFEGKQDQAAVLQADGSLKYQDQRGSIHLVARQIRQAPCNGWDVWFYVHPETGELCPVNDLRQQYLREHLKDESK